MVGEWGVLESRGAGVKAETIAILGGRSPQAYRARTNVGKRQTNRNQRFVPFG